MAKGSGGKKHYKTVSVQQPKVSHMDENVINSRYYKAGKDSGWTDERLYNYAKEMIEIEKQRAKESLQKKDESKSEKKKQEEKKTKPKKVENNVDTIRRDLEGRGKSYGERFFGTSAGVTAEYSEISDQVYIKKGNPYRPSWGHVTIELNEKNEYSIHSRSGNMTKSNAESVLKFANSLPKDKRVATIIIEEFASTRRYW